MFRVGDSFPLTLRLKMTGYSFAFVKYLSTFETTRLYTVPGEQELQQAVEKLGWE